MVRRPAERVGPCLCATNDSGTTVMTVDWVGIGLGVTLGLAYNAASCLTIRYAARRRMRRFMFIVFGSMVVRLFVALGLVALVLVLVPVQPSAFVGALLVVFLIGLAAEVAAVHRRSKENRWRA